MEGNAVDYQALRFGDALNRALGTTQPPEICVYFRSGATALVSPANDVWVAKGILFVTLWTVPVAAFDLDRVYFAGPPGVPPAPMN